MLVLLIKYMRWCISLKHNCFCNTASNNFLCC